MRFDDSGVLQTVLLIAGLALAVVGGFMYMPAVDHLHPEFRDQLGMGLFWRSERYTREGQRLLRRAWRVQLAGIALVILAVLLGQDRGARHLTNR